LLRVEEISIRKKEYPTSEAIILAGGESSRFDSNKALTKFFGKTLIEVLAARLSTVFSKVSINTNTPDDYAFLNLEMFSDLISTPGPLRGVHAALQHAKPGTVFLCSCDMPFLSTDFFRYMASQQVTNALIPKTGRYLQWLNAVYSHILYSYADAAALDIDEQKGKHKRKPVASMDYFLQYFHYDTIAVERLPFYHDYLFFNMNTRSDYRKALDLIDTGRVDFELL
jgi:molybdopterin-guanine dinucleotide biosynthesis protein A